MTLPSGWTASTSRSIITLNATFFEEGAMDRQDVTAMVDRSVLKYGRGRFVLRGRSRFKNIRRCAPTNGARPKRRRLSNLACQGRRDPFTDSLEYTNPHSGRSVMDTIAAWVQLLRPGIHTEPIGR